MPSEYYSESVKLGKQFQKENSTWSGNDCKNYHNQIRLLMDKYNAKTVLDYGCGKGQQYITKTAYGLHNGYRTEPMTFKTRINADSVHLFDPCISDFEIEPVGKKFDAVICTQVLGSIPDADIEWVKNKLMNYATKFVFIGLHNPDKPVKSKKQIYNSEFINYNRNIEWYQERFKEWKGPPLYWWFRNCAHPINNWYLNQIR